jgi:hypothetical protein
MGVAAALGTMLWKGAQLGCRRDLDNPIWLNVFRNRKFRELPPSMRTRLSMTSLMMGLTGQGIPAGWLEVRGRIGELVCGDGLARGHQSWPSGGDRSRPPVSSIERCLSSRGVGCGVFQWRSSTFYRAMEGRRGGGPAAS